METQWRKAKPWRRLVELIGWPAVIWTAASAVATIIAAIWGPISGLAPTVIITCVLVGVVCALWGAWILQRFVAVRPTTSDASPTSMGAGAIVASELITLHRESREEVKRLAAALEEKNSELTETLDRLNAVQGDAVAFREARDQALTLVQQSHELWSRSIERTEKLQRTLNAVESMISVAILPGGLLDSPEQMAKRTARALEEIRETITTGRSDLGNSAFYVKPKRMTVIGSLAGLGGLELPRVPVSNQPEESTKTVVPEGRLPDKPKS